MSLLGQKYHYNFYSHAREGRDNLHKIHLSSSIYFYSHAREGRDCATSCDSNISVDFYSHAREGRDAASLILRRHAAISTHTPARGVTLDFPP